MTNEINCCANCGLIITEGKFCSYECEEEANLLFHEDMAQMPQEELAELMERNLCPVCEDKPKLPRIGTCGDPNCADCWAMAWDTK